MLTRLCTSVWVVNTLCWLLLITGGIHFIVSWINIACDIWGDALLPLGLTYYPIGLLCLAAACGLQLLQPKAEAAD